MRYSVVERAGELTVTIEGSHGKEDVFLRKIRECCASAWACPSAECRNIGSIDERTEDGTVHLRLIPRHNEKLEPAGIDECLCFMFEQAIEG
jgi:hypothetical protein